MSTIRSCRRGTALPATLAAALAIVLALAAAGGCAKRDASKPSAAAGAVGTAAPEFELPNLEGALVRSSDFRGKVVLLDFWATWCAPCRKEVPHFVRLQSKYRGEGLAIVGLSLDAGGARDVRPFADEFDVNYTMLIGNERTAKAYGGIVGIPTTFVIDRSGTIVKRFLGYTDPEVFEETIRPLLAAS